MAAAKKPTAAETKVREFNEADLKALLPAGFDAKDFDIVGGLRPICAPEVMFDVSAPVVGWVVALLDMPKREDGTAWQALLVELTGNAQAKVGDDVTVIPAGKEVLIPVNGSLKNNPELLNAACDGSRVFLGMFFVKGQVDTGKPSPMWDFEVRLHKKTMQRVGKYTLQQHNKVEVVPPPALNGGAGQVVDKDGKTVESVVG